MKVLNLILNFHWFSEIEAGRKSIEYRRMIPRWEKQIWQKRHELTHLRVRRAYTPQTLTLPISQIDVGPCPIPGWSGDFYRIHLTAAS